MPSVVIPNSVETAVAWHSSGLVGTIGLRVIDNVGGTPYSRVTAGVLEYPASSGIYQAVIPNLGITGDYTIVWDDTIRFDAVPLTLISSGVFAPTGGFFDQPNPEVDAFDQPNPE